MYSTVLSFRFVLSIVYHMSYPVDTERNAAQTERASLATAANLSFVIVSLNKYVTRRCLDFEYITQVYVD